MKPKDLLVHLSHLEAKLNDFSFEELTTDEASSLKNSFHAFKTNLEGKVFGEPVQISTIHKSTIGREPIRTDKETDDHNKAKLDKTSGMLIATVSHEMRTPLNGIIGFTDLLKESQLSGAQKNQVDAIQSASRTLLEIINELLEYSKLRIGLEHFESVDFNFYRIVKDVMYLCNTLIVDKNVTLKVDMEEDIPEVLKGDPSKLSQVLLNLLGNAIKFVEEGSISLRVRKKGQPAGNFLLEFEISDTGIGISEDNLKNIFESFRQAEFTTHKKYGGSGLGLSIVKQIIENLNGNISVSSKLGVGTTFKFVLPFEQGSGSYKPEQNKPAVTMEANKALVKGMRILVFEDNLLNQRLIEQRLRTWGCRVHITDNALYGLNVLENHKIDMVLMDLRMPVMNGFEVSERIRHSTNKSVKNVPIIALTADFTIRDEEQFAVSGINDYILKPYSPEELLQKLIKSKKDMDSIYAIEAEPMEQPVVDAHKTSKVNLANILKECQGEMILLEELVVLYKQNVLEFIGKVRLHLNNKNMEEIEFAAHKVKSGLAMMGAFSLHKLAAEIYNVSRTDKDARHLEFLYGCFLEEYPIVETAINAELEKLGKN
ncbi:ATP-binding protein [Spongiimicrobium sp. 3-5]|uniref:ATP-binding protein n=1 Tax=Spongiimicrobium sp. 3-5 TaxID=3332596 RepID=UPI003980421B